MYLNGKRLSSTVLAALNTTCGASSTGCSLPGSGNPWAAPYNGSGRLWLYLPAVSVCMRMA